MARNQRKYNTEYSIGPADITTTMNIYAEAAKEKSRGQSQTGMEKIM